MKRRGFLKLLAAVPVALAIMPEERPKKLTQKDKERIIGELLRTSEGRKKLTEAMRQPLRRAIDYKNVSRKVLSVQPLPVQHTNLLAEIK
jgi:hypothetical protein